MTNEIERALNELDGNVDDLLESLCPDHRYEQPDGGQRCPECPMARGVENTECNLIDQRKLIFDLRQEIDKNEKLWMDKMGWPKEEDDE